MKGIDELDHYELLEVPRTATAAQLERAYRVAQQTYSDGSLALYSVFESLDAATIRTRLDEAYRVLSDEETRATYDEEQANSAPSVASGAPSDAPFVSAEGAAPEQQGFDSFDEIVEEYDALEEYSTGDFDGTRLRRARLFRGYEIDDISDATKVSSAHLRNIEDENFDDLPADVYVRGFVTAYAQTIGLDSKIVVPGYMARVLESRGPDRRGRFLGRR